ncbi:hypothetical protein GCM10022200_02530 [Microbacterium awajiense]|uniref:Uncharacterized protein n=1 Tax=Microbacterium awajiense TaxID=415214 RepID=A0ABP7A2Q9_9MICO
MRQWQLHAKKGDILLTMTFTSRAADTDFYREDRDIILPSVRMDGE